MCIMFLVLPMHCWLCNHNISVRPTQHPRTALMYVQGVPCNCCPTRHPSLPICILGCQLANASALLQLDANGNILNDNMFRMNSSSDYISRSAKVRQPCITLQLSNLRHQ